MGILIQLAAIIFVACLMRALWKAARPLHYFTIRVVNGEPKAVEGKVTPALLGLVREVAAFNGLKKGWVSGVAGPMGIRLEFSRSISEEARQQLRNGWGALGWKVGMSKARRR